MGGALDCPNCSPGSGKFRLGISLRTHAAFCWVCGRLDCWQVLADLTGRGKGTFRTLAKSGDPGEPARKARGKYAPPSGTGPLSKVHEDYLRSRGLDPARTARTWGLLGTGRLSELPWRVVIPVTRHGEDVSWTARAVWEGAKAKYHNARPEQESYPAKEWLYGLDLAGSSALVHEGPGDVWKVGPGAVCTFGVGWSPAQLYLLARLARRVICFDSEPAAQARAEALCRELAPLPGETLKVCVDAKDPGSAGDREVASLRKLIGR